MLMVYAKCVVAGINMQSFLSLAEKLVKETRKEPGNISYELVQGAETKNIFAFVERWKDQGTLDTHMNTAHFQTLIPQIEKLTEGGIDISVHEVLI